MAKRKMSGEEKALLKVREQDEDYGVPTTIYWTTEQVADWIEDLGFPNYRECIEKNLINGRHLILLDASKLPEIGIYDFEHIKVIAAAARKLLGLEKPIANMEIAMSDPMIAYIERKRRRGSYTDHISFQTFLYKHKRWFDL